METNAAHEDAQGIGVAGARRAKGVKDAAGSAGDKTLTVEFDETKASEDEIKKAMARIGYEASEVWTW